MDQPRYAQSAVIPFRETGARLEILLITSIRRRRWIVPKGIVEPDLTPAASACKEADEEAGVRGRVIGEALGRYEYAKWGGLCEVEVFAMKVTEEFDTWEEAALRTRCWLPLPEAVARVEEPDLRELLQRLPEHLAAHGDS